VIFCLLTGLFKLENIKEEGPVMDLVIEMFDVSMEPLLGFACKAGAYVADLKFHVGRPEGR
jgi:hypothetical protein